MANKDRNKRSARKARAAERDRVEAAQVASGNAPVASAEEAVDKGKGTSVSKASTSKPAKAAAGNRPVKKGPFKRLRYYFDDVRVEMHRVVWPSQAELKSYSVATIVMVVVVGLLVWLVDSGIVALLVGYTGLRG